MSTDARTGVAGYSPARVLVVAICCVTIIFDGYDLIVYGAVVPSLLEYQQWALTPTEAGRIGSYALVGMLFGALIVGTITDLVGRRKIMLFCIIWFSVAMGLCAIAPSPEVFGLLRFIAGLGLGGVVPTSIALTIEYAPPHRRSLTNAIMYSGYSVGGILAALLAIPLIPALGWRVMFWIGLAPLVLIVPLAYKLLPESISFLLANGRRQEAEALAERYHMSLEDEPFASREESRTAHGGKLGTIASLFARNYVVATALFWMATFMGLLLIYGLNTWLAQIMREAGYPLGSALAFLLVLNLGAILGTPLAGLAADRFGSKVVTTGLFLAAAVCITLLSIELPTLGLYLLVAVAGVGTIGTTILVNAYTANHYPAGSRATALGWALGFGRLGAILGPLYGGFVLASTLGLDWNFYAFAIPALIGALVMLLVPRSPIEANKANAKGTATAAPSR